MNYRTDRKMFFVLLAACLVTSIGVIPYALALSPAVAALFTPAVFAAQIAQALVLFAFAAYFGLRLSKRVGLGAPILEGALRGEPQARNLKSILGISVGLGVLSGVLIILFSLFWTSFSVAVLGTEASIPVWKTLLASFYGGIGEETLLRFFLMTFLVWCTFKIAKTPEGRPTTTGIWIAIILSAIIFGLGHLPITGTLTTITPSIIVRALVLNGAAGIIFGWLYWKRGIESAMIAHFSADIVIHVLVPVVASFFLI